MPAVLYSLNIWREKSAVIWNGANIKLKGDVK